MVVLRGVWVFGAFGVIGFLGVFVLVLAPRTEPVINVNGFPRDLLSKLFC